MNKVILMGRLTRDPDIRYGQGENASIVARFSLAVDRRFKKQNDEQTADFINCVAFSRTAEFAERYLKKGTKVAACGRIQTGSYTNRDGQKVYTTDVIVEELEFAESKNAAGGADNPYQDSAAGYTQAPQKPDPAQAANSDFMNIPDGINEDLPFN